MSCHIYIAHDSMCYREICKEIVGGQRDRGHTQEIGPIDPGRGSNDCCTDLVCGPRSRG